MPPASGAGTPMLTGLSLLVGYSYVRWTSVVLFLVRFDVVHARGLISIPER
jgi:hypothetical protein